jgi:hypothetical protein
MKAFYNTLLFNLLTIVLSIGHLGYATSASSSHSYNTISSFDNMIEENLEVIKVIPFNGTIPSSITVDPISNLVYVSVRPDYSANYLSQSCSGESNVTSKNVSDSSSTCSVIYVLDGQTEQIIDVIRLGPGEQVHDIGIDPSVGRIYATGEYNYLAEDSEGNGEQIPYEDDVVYIISNINYTNSNKNYTRSYSANASINTERITLYGEIQEGKEGDMSDVAVDTNSNTNTNTVYAGIRYYQGGRAGLFIIPDDNQIDSKPSGGNNKNNLSNAIKFIPFENTGPEQILVNDQLKIIYALLEYDDFIAIIDGSTNEIKEKIILQNPRGMSINPSKGLLYVASGDSFWFNVIDMNTNKVVAVNTQISYPIASAVNNITGKVYVAECLDCDDFDFTNGTSIYVLNSNGSTINWNTYENIKIEENGLAISPITSKLYAIGMDTKSEISILYIIDISSKYE